MRAYRKRPWAVLVVDMTPLIDVIFLIIIFFIILINFSQIHIRNVVLPRADEAYASDDSNKQKMLVTIKSRDEIFVQREQVTLATMADVIGRQQVKGSDVTALVRANEEVPYEVIKRVMLKLATANIDKVQFATWEGGLTPLSDPDPVPDPAVAGDAMSLPRAR